MCTPLSIAAAPHVEVNMFPQHVSHVYSTLAPRRQCASPRSTAVSLRGYLGALQEGDKDVGEP